MRTSNFTSSQSTPDFSRYGMLLAIPGGILVTLEIVELYEHGNCAGAFGLRIAQAENYAGIVRILRTGKFCAQDLVGCGQWFVHAGGLCEQENCVRSRALLGTRNWRSRNRLPENLTNKAVGLRLHL